MFVSSLAGKEHGAVMLVARPGHDPVRYARPGRRRQTPGRWLAGSGRSSGRSTRAGSCAGSPARPSRSTLRGAALGEAARLEELLREIPSWREPGARMGSRSITRRSSARRRPCAPLVAAGRIWKRGRRTRSSRPRRRRSTAVAAGRMDNAEALLDVGADQTRDSTAASPRSWRRSSAVTSTSPSC